MSKRKRIVNPNTIVKQCTTPENTKFYQSITDNPRESKIEAYLREEVELIGGEAYKFTCPGRQGVPDRMCVVPGYVPFFVETKSKDGDVSPQQRREIKRLLKLGCKVFTCFTKDEVDKLLKCYGRKK